MTEQFDHIMVDLETTDTLSTSVILSIGACAFNKDKISDMKFYLAVDLQDSIDKGHSISAETLRWWMKQLPEAQAVFSDKSAVPIQRALEAYKNWCYSATNNSVRNAKLWANGASFDTPMLAYAFKEHGVKDPIAFWNHRCYRTVKAAHSVKEAKRTGTHHNALDDAVHQAQHLIEINKKAGGIYL